MRRRLAIALFIVGWLVCSGQAAAAETIGSWRVGVANWTAEHALFLRLDAAHFAACGRHLRSSATLIPVARWRAEQMGLGGWLGHVIPPRGVHIDYYLRRDGIRFGPWGEIAQRSGYSPALAASVAYTSFRHSPEHWAVVTNCAYTEVGVGAYRAAPVLRIGGMAGDIRNDHALYSTMEVFDVVYLRP